MKVRFLGALALVAICPAVSVAQVQTHEQLPFAIGERLTYRARAARMGVSGRGAMWIEGPMTVRGRQVYVLRFDFRAGIGPVKAVDETESWLDPMAMASLRFHKHERHPLSRFSERVELYPDERRWLAEDGRSGEMATNAPLDELSFMYFIRTLPLVLDSTYRFDRHFEAGRNPATVRVVRRETVTTGAGEFRTLLVEMRVKDPRRYRGDGVIKINLSDDDRRLPVRIESSMPIVGNAVLALESFDYGLRTASDCGLRTADTNPRDACSTTEARFGAIASRGRQSAVRSP